MLRRPTTLAMWTIAPPAPVCRRQGTAWRAISADAVRLISMTRCQIAISMSAMEPSRSYQPTPAALTR